MVYVGGEVGLYGQPLVCFSWFGVDGRAVPLGRMSACVQVHYESLSVNWYYTMNSTGARVVLCLVRYGTVDFPCTFVFVCSSHK